MKLIATVGLMLITLGPATSGSAHLLEYLDGRFVTFLFLRSSKSEN